MVDKICDCLNRSNSKSNFLKIDFVDGNCSDPEEVPEKRRNVLVLKLKDLNVKCENGLRHELYFPAASVAGKTLSTGDYLAYSMSSTGDIHEHKPIPVPIENGHGEGEEDKKEIDKLATKKPQVERQMSKSMDDVKAPRGKPLKSRSAQNVTDKAGRKAGEEEQSMSDMGSIELIIISDEFLHETQNQEVIILSDQKQKTGSPARSKSFQIKKNFLHSSKGNPKDRGDYFKRAAEAKAKAAKDAASGGTGATATIAGKRLVIVSDEFKRKSLENTVKIVKSKEKLSTKKPLAKNRSISNAMVDLNSKIISCVLQSYEEPDRLEDKALEAKLLKARLANSSSVSKKKSSCPGTPKK